MIQVDLDHLCLFISKYLIIYVHKRNLCRKSSGGYKVYNPRESDKESCTQNVTISNEMLCTVQSGGNVTCLEGSRQRDNGILARQILMS